MSTEATLGRLLDEAKVLADDRPFEVGHLTDWSLDAEDMIRRLVKAFNEQPARKPLTEEEKLALLKKHFNAVCVPEWFDALLLDIEAAHGIEEKNT